MFIKKAGSSRGGTEKKSCRFEARQGLFSRPPPPSRPLALFFPPSLSSLPFPSFQTLYASQEVQQSVRTREHPVACVHCVLLW